MSEIEVIAKNAAHSSIAGLSAKSRRHWPLRDALDDLRVRSGIKLGLAALLALYCAELLRLEHPNWAILTVFAVMSVPYAGSVAVVVVMQVAGAIAGALIGVWLVGDYASTPAIFLTLFFLVIAFASYKYGQFPASQVSLAYFLLGLSTISVTTFGVADPADVWQTGINRVLEILDGSMSALLVTTLLWPRYAREDFLEAGRAALQTIGRLFAMYVEAWPRGEETRAEREQIHRTVGERLSVLQDLLQAGSRESAFFRARIANYHAFLASLTRLFHLAMDLSRWQAETSVLSQIEDQFEAVAAAISEEFDILAAAHPGERLWSSRLNEAFTAFEDKMSEIRSRGATSSTQAQANLAFCRGIAALRSLRDELNNMRSLVQGLQDLSQPAPDARPQLDFQPTIDWFWVKIGVKGGLAATISVLLLMWIHPPGPGSIPLVAWLLTVLGRPFLRAGGTGDLRSFQNGFLAALGSAVWAAFLVLIMPFLTDYLVMNLVLFLLLFVFGFFTARRAGVNFWMQIGMLAIFVFVGLEPQQPIATQAIIDAYVGFIVGIGLATIVGRLIWPVLPQMVMRDNLLAVFAHLKALLSGDLLGEKNQLATLPAEALHASRQIRIAGCNEQEKGRLGALIRALQTLATRTTILVGRRQHLLPETRQAILRPRLERLDAAFKQMLDSFAECLREGDCRRELPNLGRALGEMDGALKSIHQSELFNPNSDFRNSPFGPKPVPRMLSGHLFGVKPRHLERNKFVPLQVETWPRLTRQIPKLPPANSESGFKGQQPEPPVQELELLDHYLATVEALEECRRLIGTLQIHRYWGHCGL